MQFETVSPTAPLLAPLRPQRTRNHLDVCITPTWRPLKVMHVIGSLDAGGAEHSLCTLVESLDPLSVTTEVVALIPGGSLTESLRQRGIATHTVSMRSGHVDPRGILRLSNLFKQRQPDLVVTWMYHANLIGGLAARMAGRIPVVWNVRSTTLDRRRIKLRTRLVARFGARLSHWLPSRIVFVARASRECHLTMGYSAARSLIIPNGFDTARFHPRPAARMQWRRELGIAPAADVVGIIGRFHPDKDHRTFIRAAGHIHRRRPSTRFVLCGEGLDANNTALADWIDAEGIRSATHLLGYRDDVPSIAAALDVAVCSSLTEGFPRAVGESMACEVPCVVTDVGDAAYLLADTGRLAWPGDDRALGDACLELLSMSAAARHRLGAAARQRIVDHFHLADIAPRHLALWRDVVESRHELRQHLEPALETCAAPVAA